LAFSVLTLLASSPTQAQTAATVPAGGAAPSPAATAPVGIFENHSDVGVAPVPGKAVFDADKKTYTITGGGNDIWAKVDAFQYAWKQMSGNFTLSADIAILDNPTATPQAHRKGVLMIRQSLDADAPFVDAALHGNGLTALQFRETKGDAVRTVHSDIVGPVRLRIEKHGDAVTLFVGKAGEDPKYTGASYSLKFQEPFYVGFGVSAHNGNDTSTNQETVVFSNVELKTDLPATTPKLYATLETQVSNPVNAAQSQGTDRAVLYVSPDAIEGPVWLPDNSAIIFSSGGHLMKLPIKLPPRAPAPVVANAPVAAGEPVIIATPGLNAVSRVHGLSPDGSQIIFVNHPPGQPRPAANTYMLPLAGGTPQLLTPNTGAGSTLSPHGNIFAYDTDTVADIYTIPLDGSAPATRLTMGAGKNYGPQFSHDGNSIIFCSDRSGTMQIWQMKPDGTELKQLTNDDYNNWFPHWSPNDNAILFISYPKTVTADSANTEIQVRRLNPATGTIDFMARILGGPTSAPTWSPSGGQQQIVFVSYQWVY